MSNSRMWTCSICFVGIQCGTKTGASFFFFLFFFTSNFFSLQTIFSPKESQLDCRGNLCFCRQFLCLRVSCPQSHPTHPPMQWGTIRGKNIHYLSHVWPVYSCDAVFTRWRCGVIHVLGHAWLIHPFNEGLQDVGVFTSTVTPDSFTHVMKDCKVHGDSCAQSRLTNSPVCTHGCKVWSDSSPQSCLTHSPMW